MTRRRQRSGMPDRSDQKTVERDSFAETLEEDFGDDDTGSAASADEDEGPLASRLPSVESVFSPRVVLLRGAVLLGGAIAAGFVPLVGGILAVALGVFGAAFLLGAASDESRYLETATAGAALGGLLALARSFSVAIASGGTTRLAAVGLGVGVVASLLGLYFGRDLRKGLTQEIGGGGPDGPAY
jgi:hypothetical protein